MTTVLVDSKIFNQMISYKPYTENQSQSKKVKFTLLDDIKNFFSDKWFRLKNGTRSALDMMAFLSTERGFVYASQLYLGERYGVSDRTIRRIVRELEEAGLIYTVYRRHSKGNSKGKPVYLFTQHPYFEYWANLLNLNIQDRVQEEKVQTYWESKQNSVKKVPTYIHQSIQERDINISDNKVVQFVVNRVQDSIKRGTKITYLSSYIDRIVRSLENQAIYAENMRLVKQKKQQEEEMSQLAIELGIRNPKEDVFYDWLNAT